MNGARTMNRKEQQFLRRRQTTQRLMGVTRLTEHGAVCGRDELLFYLLRPDNLSILSRRVSGAGCGPSPGFSGDGIPGAAGPGLQGVISEKQAVLPGEAGGGTVSRPARLLRQDMEHLDARQSSTAASRSSSWSAGWTARPQRIRRPAIGEADPGSRLSRLPGQGNRT